MSAVIGGSLLILACVEYAAASNLGSRLGRMNLIVARTLVAAGAAVIGYSCTHPINLPTVLALELALVMLLLRRPLVETLIAPVPALLGLLGGLAPFHEATVWSSLSLASPAACAIVAIAAWGVHRFEKARAQLLGEPILPAQPRLSGELRLLPLRARSASSSA